MLNILEQERVEIAVVLFIRMYRNTTTDGDLGVLGVQDSILY